jgi:hypothetical protein
MKNLKLSFRRLGRSHHIKFSKNNEPSAISLQPSAGKNMGETPMLRLKNIVPLYIGANVHDPCENGTPTTRGFLR